MKISNSSYGRRTHREEAARKCADVMLREG